MRVEGKTAPVRWSHRLQDLALHGFSLLLGPIGWRGAQRLGAFLGAVAYHLLRIRVGVTRQNLRRAFPELPDEEIDRLREQGASRGLVMTDFFGCVFRRSLRRPFYKQDGCADYIDYACQSCFQRDECQAETNLSAVEAKAREAASRIGLVLGAARHLGPHTSRFECGAPTSRGDETYLSELLNHRILLSSVPEGSEGGSFGGTSREILERWERRGMFPAGEVERLSERIEQSLREG